MSWLALKLFFGGALKSVAAWLSHRSFWQLAFGAALILAGIQTIRFHAEQRQNRKLSTQLSKTIAGREADRAAYVKAQADAAARNKAHAAATEAQSRKVSDDERQAYLSDLARLRADDQRLRKAAAKGAPNGAGSPAPTAPASGADADGLHLPASEHLQAAEIELRLMHLQNYVEKQLSIDPNK
jgi:predicted RNA-binding protein YlxR (DUF448 family)